jgi:hypothetical protein
VLLTLICGGTMFGNWAVGSPDMATRPTMVIRIEMTMATIGRLMKNLDMAAYPLLAGAAAARRVFRRAWRRCLGDEGLRIDGHTRAHLLGTLGDHLLARLQPLADDPVAADALANRHRPDVDLVVGADHGHQVLALDFGDGPLRHQQRALVDRHRCPYLAVLAGAQQVVGIGEQGCDLEGAGAHIDLPVEHGRLARVRVKRAIHQEQLKRDMLRLLARSESRVGNLEILALADVEIDLDRIDGRHGGQFGRHARTQQVADLRLGDAGNAADRRADLREAEIEFRRPQRSLGGLELGLG